MQSSRQSTSYKNSHFRGRIESIVREIVTDPTRSKYVKTKHVYNEMADEYSATKLELSNNIGRVLSDVDWATNYNRSTYIIDADKLP